LTHTPTKPTTPFDALPVPVYIEPNGDNCGETISSQPTLPAIWFHSPRGPANISCQALYHVINLAFNAPPVYAIPRAFYKSYTVHHIFNVKEVCNGAIHPVTKETITKYTKLINNLDLKKLCVSAMSKELHRLVQRKEGITVATDTIFFFSHMTKSGVSPKTAPSPMRAL
jgi:hypothetical protein